MSEQPGGRRRFSIDLARASALQSGAHGADPHLYILDFARAATLCGASSLVLTPHPRSLTLRFDGAALDLAALATSAPLSEASTPPQQALALLRLGLSRAQQAHSMRHLTIESGAGAARSRLMLSPGQPPVHVAAPSSPRDTRIILQQRAIPSPRAAWRAYQGQSPEAQHLRERCAWHSAQVIIHEEVITARIPTDAHAHTRWERDDSHARAWLWLDDGPSQWIITQLGVCIGHITAPLPYGRVCVVMECPTLRVDLSGAALVEDEVWWRCHDEVLLPATHELLWESLSDVRDDPRMPHAAWAQSLAIEVMREAGAARTRGRPLSAPTLALCALFEALPLWRVADATPGQRYDEAPRVSLRQAGVGLTHERAARVSHLRFPQARLDDGAHALLDEPPGALDWLATYLGKPHDDVTDALATRERARVNAARWEARPPLDGDAMRTMRACLTARLDATLLEVGTDARVAMHAGPGALMIARDRRLLRLDPLPDWPLGRQLLSCDGPLEVNARFDDVERASAQWGEVAQALMTLALRSWVQVAAQGALELDHAHDVLVALLTGALARDMARALGATPPHLASAHPLWGLHAQARCGALTLDDACVALGPLAQAPVIRLSDDERVSLGSLRGEARSGEPRYHASPLLNLLGVSPGLTPAARPPDTAPTTISMGDAFAQARAATQAPALYHLITRVMRSLDTSE